MKGTKMSTLQKRIVSRMLDNSRGSDSTPSRRGIRHPILPLFERAEYAGPAPQLAEKVDRRLKGHHNRGQDPAVLARVLLYQLQADSGQEILYAPMPQWLIDRQNQDYLNGKPRESAAERLGRQLSAQSEEG